jgi:Restriction Enzyme Adenine Methylase Associated
MPLIEIDFDVYKALIARRPSEDVTENDVLRQLLHLPRVDTSATLANSPAPSDWVTKGVRLPAGTELRASYKGQSYLARVADGALVLNGKRFDSPSAAAMSITKHPVNGWTFWQCRLPGQGRWTLLRELRMTRPNKSSQA